MATAKNTRLYLVALVIFLCGVGYLMVAGISENSMYFLNVSEALALPADKLQSARLFGTVNAEDITQVEPGPGVSFRLEDKDHVGQILPVIFTGAVPDTFKAGAEVIVEGFFAPDKSVFKAEVLMTKCPSKYQKENRE